jgi:hypothetical protein
MGQPEASVTVQTAHDTSTNFDCSMWHCATYDYDAARAGDRVCSLGEAPYLDLKSTGRKAAMNVI